MPNTPIAEGEYLTPTQVAAELHVSVLTVRRWITAGRLPASKAGPRRWLVRRSAVEEFLSSGATDERHAQESSDDPSFIAQLLEPHEH